MTRPPVITRSKTWSVAGAGGASASAVASDGPDGGGPGRSWTFVTAGFAPVSSLDRASAFTAPNPSAMRSFLRSGDAGPVVTTCVLATGRSDHGARPDRHVH